MKLRRKQSHIFQICYTDLCSIHNIPMIFPIKTHLHKRMVDFNGDRVKLDEWRPILKALSLDRSLHLIAIRSKSSCSKVLEHIDSETKCRTVVKFPVLITNFIFRRVVVSLGRCLSYNSHLKCLELDGLLLSGDYLQTLLTGLEKSSSLQHLSLHRCPLGDDGCRLVCLSLRNIPNILTVDMSGCNISERGAYFVARALQYQNLNRYGENWKQSLRYRTPDTDVMPGLRRVTLNHNPFIGDSGVGHFSSVLRDDIWLKALDLQNVGLTNSGGKELLDLLNVNKSLSILDVRNNPDLDESTFASVMNMLASNNLGKPSEYHWIQEDTLFLPRRPSYQSRDPSRVQRPLKNQDTTIQDSRHPADNRGPVRRTKSSTVARVSGTQVMVAKTRSATALTTHGNQLITKKAPMKAIPGHPFGAKQRALLKPTTVNKWDHNNAHGDVGQTPDMRAKLREISAKLEEETQKRLEAEKQKANVESELQKLFSVQKGKILMDENVVKEITEAFAVFNCFVDIFSKRGLQLETTGSELLTDQVPSEMMSVKSLSLSPRGDFETGVMDDSDAVSNNLTLSLATLDIQERKTELNRVSESAMSSPKPVAEAFSDQHSDPHQKWKKAEESEATWQFDEKGQGFLCPGAAEKGPPQSHMQKVLHEITQLNPPALELRGVLKTNLLSYLSNRQSNFPHNSVMKVSADTTPRNGCRSERTGSFGLRAESSESLYTNAEQDEDNEDGNDREDSWITESYSFSDSSPCSTLTELNLT